MYAQVNHFGRISCYKKIVVMRNFGSCTDKWLE